MSTKKMSKIMNVYHMMVRNVLKNKIHLKPYKINYYHALTEVDYFAISMNVKNF